MGCDVYDELYADDDYYDPDDFDPMDSGDDCNVLLGRHTADECRIHREVQEERRAFYEGLGLGREYQQLRAAERGELPDPEPRRVLLPDRRKKALPTRRRLSASNPNEEDVK